MSEFLAEYAEAFGLGTALLTLAIASWQQAKATRLSALVFADGAAGELVERLSEAGRRFEHARRSNVTGAMGYELAYMASVIERYLSETMQIHKHAGLEGAEARNFVVNAVRVLATGLPVGPNVMAGPVFAAKGFPEVGKLADEHHVRTPVRLESNDRQKSDL